MKTKYNRRQFLWESLALISTAGGIGSVIARTPEPLQNRSGKVKKKIPVILDTDIGDDLDDTWALMMLLRSPELEVKLITTDFGNAKYRARLLAKLLQHTGHDNIPIGIGLDPEDKMGNQSDWLGNYQLKDYPGTVYRDGVQILIETIMRSPQVVTLLCIGPVMNIAEALRREPAIAENARFVGMHGSIRVGYEGVTKPTAEWNVKVDPKSLQEVFAAAWDCSITPLDTCGIVNLKGDKYQKIYNSNDHWMRILMDNYRMWLPKADWLDPKPDPGSMSSTLFDTVAIYMAHSQELLLMEDLPLCVTDEGYTVIDEKTGRLVHCATGWKDLSGFEDKLVETITGSV